MCSWGCLVVTMPRLGSGTPGGGALSKPAPPPVSGSLRARPCGRGLSVVFPTPPAVVEELQVQILKLLLNNKDDNGVSDSQTPVWVPGAAGGYTGPCSRPRGQGWLRFPWQGPGSGRALS